MKKLVQCSQVFVLAALCGHAAAQVDAAGASYEMHTPSWRPSFESFSGPALARPSYRLDCAGPCAVARTGSVYMGSMLSQHFGAQVGYLQLGDAEHAEGVNLSVVGRAALVSGLNVYGRLGTTWGRTQAGRLPGGAGLSLGSASGWGPGYGLGLNWAFADRWSAVLDWQRHRLDYVGDETGWVRSTSVGLKYRF